MKRLPSRLEETLAFQLRASGLDKGLEREYRFCKDRMWRADFAWPEHMLLVECEGGIFVRAQRNGQDYGWHQSVERMLGDMEKYNAATLLGYRVLRYAARAVTDGVALREIEFALAGGIRQPARIVPEEEAL
jgi:very-short-patch-repair endonuclease